MTICEGAFWERHLQTHALKCLKFSKSQQYICLKRAHPSKLRSWLCPGPMVWPEEPSLISVSVRFFCIVSKSNSYNAIRMSFVAMSIKVV